MWKSIAVILCLSGYCLAGPVGLKRNMPIVQQKDDATAVTLMENLAESEPAAMAEPEMMNISSLTLPSNATSIRADITDGFSCENKTYGYYADIENDCQIFHVCLPVTYTNGKENTFRWSFICPEETIFSQDSFTCMRPDDMTITCDESIAYYELNRNFGNVDPEYEKEETEVAAESDKKEPEVAVMPAESQPEPIKPMQQQQEKEKETPKPVQQQTIKVQKPNRRKPGVSYASQNKPINPYPLRKMPQVQPAKAETPVNQASEDIEKHVEEAVVKPVVQTFSRRPVPVLSNTVKDKVHSSKPETMTGIRTQLYNQNRKRPSMFNKKPVEEQEDEQVKIELEPVKVEIPMEQHMFSSSESEMSNTNAATEVADNEVQASVTNEIFAKPEVPKEAEKTKTEEEFNTVEESVQTPPEEPQQVLEAFEEIPAVIAEVIETQANIDEEEEEESKKEEQIPHMVAEEMQSTKEETKKTEQETQKPEEGETLKSEESKTAAETAEVSQSAEEIPTHQDAQIAEESQKVEGTQDIEESQTAEETKTYEESHIVEEPQSMEETHANEKIPETQEIVKAEESQSVEEIQSVKEVKPVEEILSVQEPQPAEDVAAIEEQTPQESQISEETVTEDEETKPEQPEQFPAPEETKQVKTQIAAAEQPEQFSTSEETEQVKTQIAAAEPAIFENSEEGVSSAPIQTLEEMEDERPAEAPESVVATEEMSHPGAMVQQMMEDMEESKQSIGGFKPVDPVMAHEAEQLIADFINTLRNNDFTNETPGMMVQQHNGDDNQQNQAEESVNLPEEVNKMESSEVTNEELPEVANKTENEEEIIKSNDSENKPQQSEINETQPEIVDSQAVSQENNAEEIEDDNKTEEDNLETMAEINTDTNESVALKSLENQSSENVQESQKSEEQPKESINMMMSNMPQEMFQIPVQVITSPAEEIPKLQTETEMKPIEMIATSSEDKLEEETPAVTMEGYKPLSIDDIVELVKERLDHMPQDKMETPMQLENVLEDMKEDKATEEEIKEEEEKEEEIKESEVVKQDESQSAQSEEEIVMPIYQRTVQPVNVEIGIQTEPQNQELTAEHSETSDSATDVKEKSNRSYRSRSMLTPKVDPRKRRFLFKSDKNQSS